MPNEARTNWYRYAVVYDLMTDNNPAYQELVHIFHAALDNHRFNANDLLVDIGAGTGNFSLDLAKRYKESRVLHVDSNIQMNVLAQEKAKKRALTNIDILTYDTTDISFVDNSISAIVCVHFLYVLRDPRLFIGKMYRWLKSGGIVFACDPGRTVNVNDWFQYLFKASYKKHGLLKTLALFYRGRAVAQQNRYISTAQKRGVYWLHSHEDFCQAFTSVGFDVISSQTAYRGISDIVICRKPIKLHSREARTT